MREAEKTLAVYVHIPFCLRKCPYCDFTSYAIDGQRQIVVPYIKALTKELHLAIENYHLHKRECSSLYIGGGTPTVLDASLLELIVSEVFSCLSPTSDCEVSIEANPATTATELGVEKLKTLFNAGIHRLSLGAQSFSPNKLSFLGRIHTPEDVITSVDRARSAGFENINLDLMFGTKEETLDDWKRDLEQATALRPTHISAYGLSIEPSSEFYLRQQRGEKLTGSDETVASMYRYTQSYLAKLDYIQYEISNYAQQEKECRHNLTYWSDKEYLGLGASAHSFIYGGSEFGTRWANVKSTSAYIAKLESQEFPREFLEAITREQSAIEFFFLGLRTTRGISFPHFDQKFGASFQKQFAPTMETLCAQKLIEATNESCHLLPQGFLLADSVIGQFVDALDLD